MKVGNNCKCGEAHTHIIIYVAFMFNQAYTVCALRGAEPLDTEVLGTDQLLKWLKFISALLAYKTCSFSLYFYKIFI